MFILVGEFVHYAGYNNGLYNATHKWFGHYKGGLAITTIMACAAFSAISGSNTATAATMSSVAIPEMKKYGYHPMLNAGSVAAGATLGVLIPPSIVLVVYGLYTGQSIGKLFFGNVIPSAILTVVNCGDCRVYLLAPSRLGPKGGEEHVARTVQGPAGYNRHPDPFWYHHVRSFYGRRNGNRGRGGQLHPGAYHLPHTKKALLGRLHEISCRYPSDLMPRFYDRCRRRHIRALHNRYTASL